MEVQDSQLTVRFASVSGKLVIAVFDGGVLTSDIGSMLLREVESKIGILSRIVEVLPDRRHPSYVDHPMADLIINNATIPSESGRYRRKEGRFFLHVQ